MNVAHDGRQSVEWLIQGLTRAFDAIQAEEPDLADGRVKPMIALPTLGVRQGGYDGVQGLVICELHSAATRFVAQSNFDVVFVVDNAADYAAFQHIRRSQTNSGPNASTLLADKIRTADTALLLGAGVSIAAGLPSWDQLLEDLRKELLPDLSTEDFNRLDVLDRAQLLSKSEHGTTLNHRVAAVAEQSANRRPTLAHCLLASLQVAKAVTTNYDTLYEEAFAAAHGASSIAVLPREVNVAGQSWVLKMHGDTSDPANIVLSRKDFVLYDADRRPLGSIVQSLMATGHLIVIGASMTDDNVLRLAHEVLELDKKNGRVRALGTVVTLQPDPLRKALWEGDFDYIVASRSADIKIAARDLEILLDGVALHCSVQTPYLLDLRYAELLDDNEKVIAQKLREAVAEIDALPQSGQRRWSALRELGS